MYFGLGTTDEGDGTTVDVNAEGMPIYTVTGYDKMPMDPLPPTRPNCPGDPGCPGYVAPGSEAYRNSLLEALLAIQVQQQAQAQAQAQSETPVKSSGTDNTLLLLAGAALVLFVIVKTR